MLQMELTLGWGIESDHPSIHSIRLYLYIAIVAIRLP